VISELGGAVAAEWFKANHIKRLQRMGQVRGKHGQQYFVSLAVFDKVYREVATVAVEYEEAPVPAKTCFLRVTSKKRTLCVFRGT
jgi:hypothetical protein